MTHTENYNLNQWEKTDRLMMDDFNADNAKLDAALATLAQKPFLAKLKEYRFTGSSGDLQTTLDLDLSDIDWSAWQAVVIDTTLYGTIETAAELTFNTGASSITFVDTREVSCFAKADVKKTSSVPTTARSILAVLGDSGAQVRGVTLGKPYLSYGYSSGTYAALTRFEASVSTGFFDTGCRFTVYGLR